jgi:hypothetical protein
LDIGVGAEFFYARKQSAHAQPQPQDQKGHECPAIIAATSGQGLSIFVGIAHVSFNKTISWTKIQALDSKDFRDKPAGWFALSNGNRQIKVTKWLIAFYSQTMEDTQATSSENQLKRMFRTLSILLRPLGVPTGDSLPF